MIDLIIFLSLVALGFGAGTFVEKRHYKRIQKREAETLHLPVTTTKHLTCAPEKVRSATLVQGSAVISVDYFKRFLAGLRMLFGGRLKSYESLIDRARREAVLRMQDQARRKGAKSVFNIKFETASISKGAKDTIGSVEVLAYGTAVIPRSGAEE